MSVSAYLAGVAMLVAVVGAAAAVAVLVVRRRLGHLDGATRLVAGGLVGTVALIAFHQLPLMLGVLSRGSVLLTAAVIVAAATTIGTKASPGEASPPIVGAEDRWTRVCAGVALAILTIPALAFVAGSATEPVTHVDHMEFHMPAVAAWMQSGSLWPVNLFEPLKWSGYYPNSGDVLLLSGVLPWHNDFLVRWVPLPWLALTVVAVYALTRELGVPKARSLLAAVVAVSGPVVLLFTLAAVMVDAVLFAGLTSGMLFLLRHHRTHRTSDLVLAGLGLGLALATKWYGLPAVGAIGLVYLATRPTPKDVARLAGIVLAVGGVWLVRNAIATGNPLQPLGLGPLLPSPPDPIRDELGARIVDYLSAPRTLASMLGDIVELSLRPVGLLLLAGGAAALTLAIRTRERRIVAGGAVALVVLAAYVVTPYTAQGPEGEPNFAWVNARYLMPALLIAAPAAAWALTKLPRTPRRAIEAIAVLAVADGVRQSVDGPYSSLPTAALLGAAAVALIAFAVRHARPRWALAAAAALALVLAGRAVEQDFTDGRYTALDPTLTWVAQHAEPGTRIGTAGEWRPSDFHPALALMGPNLSNSVRPLGAQRAGTIREHEDERAFDHDAQSVDLLLVTERAPHALQWAERNGFTTVAKSQRLTLLERGTATQAQARP